MPGEKYYYKASNYTNGVPSIQELDIFYAPYRNVHNTEDVYVTKIGYTCQISDLEGYLKGAPEFYISVFNADTNYNVTNTGSAERVIFAFNSRTQSQFFDGYRLLSWNPGTDSWMDCVTLYAAEYDYSTLSDTPTRIPLILNIIIKEIFEITIGNENCYYDFYPRNEDIPCGTVNVNYFDTLERKYTFTGNGFYIHISNQ